VLSRLLRARRGYLGFAVVGAAPAPVYCTLPPTMV
jgi:hypothetical protein